MSVNKYQQPVKWLLQEVEQQGVEIRRLNAEIERLDSEKADRRGRKPANAPIVPTEPKKYRQTT